HWKFVLISLLLAAAIVLPWHVWQLWHSGREFVHDYVAVNLFGRITGVVDDNHGYSSYYLEIIAQGFPFWKYLLPAAAIWSGWKALKYRTEKYLLLLMWATIPLVLFSLSQTRIGWYVSVIYPPLALLIALTLDEIVGQRLAFGGVAVIAALCCIRLPAPSDGSPEVKKFAATHSDLFGARRIYVSSEDLPCGSPPTSIYQQHSEQRVPPALLFYTKAPVTCVPAKDAASILAHATASTIVDKAVGSLNVYIVD